MKKPCLPISNSAARSWHASCSRLGKFSNDAGRSVARRALERDEIPDIVEAYKHGARNAERAGFDGVEIHGANGYLLDQFLQDSTNKRTDDYGGSIENRARLMLEVTDAVTSVWGARRVGMHLAPRGDMYSMGDTNPAATFGYVAEQLRQRGLAFIAARESVGPGRLGPELKRKFGGIYIANEGFTFETANKAIVAGEADAVAFGTLFIANPDLPRRFALQAPLNPPNPVTFYGSGPGGYTDYPPLDGNSSIEEEKRPHFKTVRGNVSAELDTV